jgi:hypothetical protein
MTKNTIETLSKIIGVQHWNQYSDTNIILWAHVINTARYKTGTGNEKREIGNEEMETK